jgi:hypothetical protein
MHTVHRSRPAQRTPADVVSFLFGLAFLACLGHLFGAGGGGRPDALVRPHAPAWPKFLWVDPDARERLTGHLDPFGGRGRRRKPRRGDRPARGSAALNLQRFLSPRRNKETR